MKIFCASCRQEIIGKVYRQEGFPICSICKKAIDINADTKE